MPPILVSKGGSSSRKAPTKADLEVRAGRIVRTDPSIDTSKATGVPKFLAQTLLKIIDAPRKVVFNTLSGALGEDVDSGYLLADKLGLGEGLPGKLVGFGLDTVLDPTTYLTAGTAGVGRAATKEAAAAALTKGAVKAGTLSEDIARIALGRVSEGGSWAAAAKESPVVREIAEKVFGSEAAAEAGKRHTLSMMNKGLSPADRATLKEAGVKTGGIRFMGGEIVPGSVTAKVTAPVAEKLAPSVAKVFSRVSPKVLADVGTLGHTFVKGMREAEDGRHLADEQLRGLANETAKVVDRKNPEQVQAFFDKIWRPGNPELWTGKLTPEAEAAAEKWSASFAAMLDEAQAAGVPIQRLQNWNGPRVLTEEARRALYGTEKQGAMRVGATPGAAKHRSIADFDEAQELMKDWLNLKSGEKFFSEDPFVALAQYGSVMNRTTHHSAAMKAFDDAGVRWGDLGKTGNNLKVQELKAAGFGKNGQKPVVEARRAVWNEGRATTKKVVTKEAIAPEAAKIGDIGEVGFRMTDGTAGAAAGKIVWVREIDDRLHAQVRTAEGRLKTGVLKSAERRSTVEKVVEQAASDPRLAKLTTETRELLEAEAQLTGTKIANKQVKAQNSLSKSLGGLQRFQHAAYKKGLKVEQELADLTPKIARYEELKAAVPGTVELTSAEVSRLSRRLDEVGRLGLKTDLKGADRLTKVHQQLDEYTTLEKQVREGEESLVRLVDEKGALAAERAGLTAARKDLQAARKVGRITDAEHVATSGRIAKQAQDLDVKEENLANRIGLHEDELADLRPKYERLQKSLTADLAKVKQTIGTAQGYEKQAKTLTQQIERLQKTLHAQEIKDIEAQARKAKSLINDVNEASKKVATQEARVAQKQEAKANLEAGLTASGKEFPGPKFSRGEVPEGFQVVSNSGLGMFDQKAWPSHIAREIETNMKMGMPIFGQEWANFTGLFKKWVTIPFPGFHARNALGGYFNNFLGGVRNNHYLINEAIQQGTADEATTLAELGLRVSDPNLTVGAAKQMMEQNRVWTRHSGGNQLADYMEGHIPLGGRRGQPGWDIPVLKQISEGAEKFGGRAIQEIEQRLRGAAFLKGLEETGDAYGARMFTMMRHGDYEELTSFERNVLKQLIPFYKWMRMNVPYQLQSAIEQPGRVGMATDFWQNVVGDPGAQQQFEAQGGMIPPAVMAGGAAFLSPDNPISKLMGGGFNTVSADLPFYGVNNYFNAQGSVPFPSLTGFAADLHPAIRTINEIVFKKRFYGGGEVGDIKDFSPVGGAYHLLGKGLEKLPGGDMLAVRTESGEIRMDSTLLSLLNVLPSSRVAALSRQLAEGGGVKAGVSLGTGLRLSPLDERSQTIEGYRRENILDEAVQELYSRGLDEDYKASAPKRGK